MLDMALLASVSNILCKNTPKPSNLTFNLRDLLINTSKVGLMSPTLCISHPPPQQQVDPGMVSEDGKSLTGHTQSHTHISGPYLCHAY